LAISLGNIGHIGRVKDGRLQLEGVNAMGLRWLNSMSVGVAEFDKDHQHMLLLLREIAAALLEGNLERARSQANKLQTLAGDHTAREEAFLRRIGFPGLEAVMAVQHESLSRIAALKNATPEDGSNPIASMEDAFVTYLLRGDINYKSFVEAAGVSDTG
jgi:hemerythrin